MPGESDMTGPDGVPTDWADCPKCGALRFYPSGRCMQGCDGVSVQKPQMQSNTTIADEKLAYRLGHEAGFRSALFQAATLIQKAARDRNRSDVNASRMAAAILDMKGVPNAE